MFPVDLFSSTVGDQLFYTKGKVHKNSMSQVQARKMKFGD